MSSARERLLEGGNVSVIRPEPEGAPRHKSPQQGARQHKPTLTFLPLPENARFNGGLFVGFHYSHFCRFEGREWMGGGEPDYAAFSIVWSTHRVTVRGENLLAVVKDVAACRCGLIEQDADPLRAKARKGYCVTDLVLEEVE